MADLANIPIDPRSPLDMLSRIECQRILADHNIKHDPHIKKIDAVKLIEANGIDVTTAIEWERITFKKADGNMSEKYVPKRVMPRETEEYAEVRDAEMQRRIDEAANRAKREKEEEVQTLAQQVAELKELVIRLSQNEQDKTLEQAVVTGVQQIVGLSEDVQVEDMKMPQLKKYAKSIGLTIPITMKKVEIVEAIKAKANEDATERSQ